ASGFREDVRPQNQIRFLRQSRLGSADALGDHPGHAAGWQIVTHGGFVSRRFLIPAAIAALSVGAAGQEMAPTTADQALRDQMQTFEAVLQKAVQHGAQAFARQEKDLPPGIELTSDDPYARGFAPPEGGGLFFYVVVPQIRASVNLFLGPQFRR